MPDTVMPTLYRLGDALLGIVSETDPTFHLRYFIYDAFGPGRDLIAVASGELTALLVEPHSSGVSLGLLTRTTTGFYATVVFEHSDGRVFHRNDIPLPDVEVDPTQAYYLTHAPDTDTLSLWQHGHTDPLATITSLFT